MSANKDYRPILDKLRTDGWIIDPTSNGHIRAAPPDKSKPIVHFALSHEPRALKNALAGLRKSGFTWDEPEDADDESYESAAIGGEEPETVDDLFVKLKHAREYRELARLTLREAAEKLAEAKRAAEQAEAEVNSAESTLRRVKERFDRVFGSEE